MVASGALRGAECFQSPGKVARDEAFDSSPGVRIDRLGAAGHGDGQRQEQRPYRAAVAGPLCGGLQGRLTPFHIAVMRFP